MYSDPVGDGTEALEPAKAYSPKEDHQCDKQGH